MGQSMFISDFYCINCGKKGIPLARKSGNKRGSMHRKKLYCLTCKMEINHVECKSLYEAEQFLQDFSEGKYKEEAEQSISFVQGNKEVQI